MKFWWVNQNKTFKFEIPEGYLWCPKKTKIGTKSPFYDYMTQVKPGDVVFSFVNQKIRAIGVIQDNCVSRDKPVEFKELWENDGWYVSVNFKEFEIKQRITPKFHFNELKPYLEYNHAPLSIKTGKGKEFYLTTVSPELASQLISLMKIDIDAVIEQLYDPDAQSHKEELKILDDPTLDQTEKDALIKSRRGQGIFKKNVKNIDPYCYLTSITDIKFLRASHIKPWSKSTNYERLDGNNGILLVPHLDHLFDNGYISFKNTGEIIISPFLPTEIIDQYNLKSLKGRYILNENQEEYMQYHRKHRFKM